MQKLLLSSVLTVFTFIYGASVYGFDRAPKTRDARSSQIRQTWYQESAARRERKSDSFSSSVGSEQLSPRDFGASPSVLEACFRLDWEREETTAEKEKGEDNDQYSSSCYTTLFGNFFLLSAIHGITDDRTRELAELNELSFVTTDGRRLALDYGPGSVALRRALEKNGVVSKADRFIQIDGAPLLIDDHDVVVFKLREPLPGVVPLVPRRCDDLEIGAAVTALVADYRNVGLTRACKTSELDYRLKSGAPCVCFVADNRANWLVQGDSGAGLVDDDHYVVAILLQIYDIGVVQLAGKSELKTSNVGVAVKFDKLIPTIKKHWRLEGPENPTLNSAPQIAAW